MHKYISQHRTASIINNFKQNCVIVRYRDKIQPVLMIGAYVTVSPKLLPGACSVSGAWHVQMSFNQQGKVTW